MGTSKSYGGPTDTSQLLPSWALNPEATASPPADGDAPAANGEPATSTPDSGADDDSTPPAPGVQPGSGPARPWASAKTRLGKVVLAGGTRESFQSAGRAYVRARGGSSGAARAARAGRRATAALAGFLSGVATNGLRPTLERLGLTSYVGRDAQQVFAAISNALAPAGASLEEAVARRATNEVLLGFYERLGVQENGLARLEAMSADDIKKAVEDSISAYVYHRWLEELGEMIEQRVVSPLEAERIEGQMRGYVNEVVHLDLKYVDVVALDWKGPAGTKLIEDLYAQAYGVLGGPV
ncbi:MAG: Qat anti-phage system associated protein QatB [Polyangiaceae bacterium]